MSRFASVTGPSPLWSRSFLGAFLLLCLWGCSPQQNLQHIEGKEATDAVLQEAQAAQLSGDFEKAYTLFKNLTISQPHHGLAHLQLGIVLQDNRKDPCTALAHYQTYLMLRPESEKSAMVEARIRQAKLQIAHEYRGGLDTLTLADERKQWEQESAQLKQSLEATQKQLVECEDELLKTRAEKEKLAKEVSRLNKQVDTMLSNENVTPPTPSGLDTVDLEKDLLGTDSTPKIDLTVKRTYVVKRGDTLWSIAQRFYGDATRNKDIREANRDQLKDGDQVEQGMLLVIPY